MLPIPFSDFVPGTLKDRLSSDSSGTALVNKADTHLEEWKQDITNLSYIKQPERCPSEFLNELGYMVSAGLLAFDTETQKRKKIYEAIERHKRRGSWTQDAKGIIDAIVGADSEIVTEYYLGEWILWAKESSDDADYTTTLGVDGVDDDLGIDLLGSFDECELAGVVWIDVDDDSLVALDIQNLIDSLADIVPAYFKVVLGYFDSITGFWTVYTTIG